MTSLKIKNIIESGWFHNFIIAVILINGAVLGLQTIKGLSDFSLQLLDYIDQLCLFIFVIEITLKLSVYRFAFFRQGWNNFDFLIVAISLVPATGELSILRAFRIFRLLRLITTVSSIRRVVAGMLHAIPGVGSVAALLVIFFYIGAVISTTIFGQDFPDWFGDLGRSMYSLFQIMTLESWSMGIVRPVMQVYPYAWLFFIPFIMLTTFMVLNLFIGIIVDAIATVKELEVSTTQQKVITREDIDIIRQEISALSARLDQLLKPHNEKNNQ